MMKLSIFKSILGIVRIGSLLSLLGLTAIGGFVTPLLAQTFPMRHFTADDGLVSNDIYSSVQDHRGYLWFGTYSGISRFDGKTFKTYNEDTSGLGGAIVATLVEDAQQQLWAGFTGGIARLEGDQFVNYTKEQGLLGNDVFDLWADPQQGIWIAIGGKGVNYINGEKITSYPIPELETVLYAILSGTPDRRVFVASKKGIYQWSPARPEFALLPLDNVKIEGVRYSKDNQTLYVIDKTALYQLKDNQLSLVAKSPLSDPLVHFSIGNQQTVWLISETEVWKHTPQGETVYNSAVLEEPSLSKVLEDREGNIWLTRWGGLSMIINANIVNTTKGLSGKIVTHLAGTPDDLWIGGDQGISRRSQGGAIAPLIESSYVNNILVDRDALFSVTESGFHTYDLQGKVLKTIERASTTLMKDSQGKIWVGTYDGVFTLKDDQLHLEINNNQGLGSNSVWALLEDRQGNIWVGTENGVSRYQKGQWMHFTTKEGLTHNSVWTFFDHPDWGLLAGTSKGISVWKGDKFEELSLKLEELISFMRLDQHGKFWVGTEVGIYRINQQKSIDLFLDKSRGLPANTTYTHSAMMDDLHLYAGTYGGLAQIDLTIQEEKTVPPLLEVNRVEVNQTAQEMATLSKPMAYSNNNLIFHYNAIYAYQPDSITFSYLLEGFDQNWSNKSPLSQATYTNLPHGKYTFQVRAHAEGDKQSEIQTVQFEILAPFWLTWPFLTVSVVLALGLLTLITRFFIIRSTRKSEEERKRINALYQKQLQLDKLKDDFLANTSHELRTPLNGIIGLGESILEGTDGPVTQDQAKNLQLIVHSGRRLSNLVNDILDFSKLQHHELPLKIESVDLRVATDVVFMLSKSLIGEKPVQLRNHIPKDIPLVMADENRLQQILMNLIANAIKFTHEGEVSLTSKIEDKFLTIAVNDTGIGIPKDKLDLIFQSFEQADSSIEREYGGTGLGLTITKKLLELHSSTLTVESKVDEGSRFTFQLPLVQEGQTAGQSRREGISLPSTQVFQADASSAPSAQNELASSSSSYTPSTPLSSKEVQKSQAGNASESVNLMTEFPGAKILAVDDEFTNLQVLKSQLAAEKYQILTAQNGVEALEIVKREQPDLILLDLMMPRMNGYDVCKHIRKQYNSSTMPVIIVTAKNQLSDMIQGFETGANDYMTKPLQKRELLSRIRSHLQVREAANKMLENIRLKTEVEERTKSEAAIKKVNEELEVINKALKEMQAQLIQAGKLAAIGEFATGVAHELNQPLLYIRSHSQMMLTDGPEKLDWESAEKTLKIVESGTDRMMKIIDHLQNFSHQSSQAFVPLQLGEILENSLVLLNEYLKASNIQPEKQYASDLPNVMGDPSQLEQVFINIISNAKDALSDQETPSLTLVTELRQQDNLSVVVVKVQDNGTGMAPEVMDKIFDPFFTTKEVGQGTGLGLSISHGIIKNHQGAIHVSSAPGKGSTFEIHLPLIKSNQ